MGNSVDDSGGDHTGDPAGKQRAVLVIADKQNAGRGRRGRDFYSPPGTGLYMSLAMGNVQEVLKMAKVTAVAAVAVATAADETVFGGTDRTKIKWVNDIYLDEKKVCGILSEAFMPMEDEGDGCVVVGIGINVKKWIDSIRNGSIKFATSLSMNVVANLITQAIVAFSV